MKRSLAAILLAALLTLASCGDASSTLSGESESSAAETDASLEAELTEYQNRIKELEEQLDGAKSAIKELQQANESLQNALDDYKNKAYVLNRTNLGGGITLSLYAKSQAESFANKITVSYPDGDEVTVADIGNLLFSDCKVSPGKKMLAATEMEITSGVYLFDIEKRETAEILMKDIDVSKKVMHVEWLDDRYLLCTVWKTGLVNGGDVYYYDTQTGNFKPLATRSNDDFQINHVVRYADDFVLFVCEKSGSGFAIEREYTYFQLNLDEIYEYIRNNALVDFDNSEKK